MKKHVAQLFFILFFGIISFQLTSMENHKKVLDEQSSTPTEYMLKTVFHKVYTQKPVESCEVNQQENTSEISPTAFMMQTVFYKIHSQNKQNPKKHENN